QARRHRRPALPEIVGAEHVVARKSGDHQHDGDGQLRLVRRGGFRCLDVFSHVQLMAGQEGIEPPTCGFGERRSAHLATGLCISYFRILETTPAPTVLPPSRIAKRSPSSMAIGLISSTVILMLSPGMTISTPAGSSIIPVTSVVRK